MIAERKCSVLISCLSLPETSNWIAPLEEEQIALWTGLHDDSYGTAAQGDPTFNCIGWDSNYTGRPLPEVDMR